MRNSKFKCEQELRLDLYNGFMMGGTLELFDQACIDSGMHVVDFGCDRGDTAIWLCNKVGARGKVTAVDSSVDALLQLQEKCKCLNVSNIDFVLADVSSSFMFSFAADVVYCRCFLMHIVNLDQAIFNMMKQLKSDGRAIMEEPMVSKFGSQESHDFWGLPVSLYVSYCAKNNIDPNFGNRLVPFFEGKGYSTIFAREYCPLVRADLAQKYLLCSLGGAANTYVSEGISTVSRINSHLRKIELMRFGVADFIHYHTVAQVVVNKS